MGKGDGAGRDAGINLTAAVAAGTLAPRQLEVVRLLADGAPVEEIAAQLQIGSDTVRTHIRRAAANLGARTRPHLVASAIRQGLIS